ncbi:hypothetical protein BC829DRAFT_404937 [Chytridium lagenaria]|nr:hypothetical protein BC829DRAFT_404937 [Chytridium lagenaria]
MLLPFCVFRECFSIMIRFFVSPLPPFLVVHDIDRCLLPSSVLSLFHQSLAFLSLSTVFIFYKRKNRVYLLFICN